MHRPHADVVGPSGTVDLLGGVGGESDQQLGTERLARHLHRRVVLPQVHAVGVRGLHQIGAVVEDEQRPVLAAHSREHPGRVERLVVARVLHPQLNDVDAPAERLAEEPLGPAFAHQVEPCVQQAFATGVHS